MSQRSNPVRAESVIARIENDLAQAHRAGIDIGDVLAAACRAAARRVKDDLTANRRGSWEAEHVRGLSAGWDWDQASARTPHEVFVRKLRSID